MPITFDQRSTDVKIKNYIFRVSEPLTAHLSAMGRNKKDDDFTRALQVLQQNLQARTESDKEFQPVTLAELQNFPVAVIKTLSDTIQEITEGEFTLLN